MILLAGNSWLFRQFWALPSLSTLYWFFNFHPSLNIPLRKSFALSRFWCFLKAVFMSSLKIIPCQWLKGPSVFFSVSTQSIVKSSTFQGSLVLSIWFERFDLVSLVWYIWYSIADSLQSYKSSKFHVYCNGTLLSQKFMWNIIAQMQN